MVHIEIGVDRVYLPFFWNKNNNEDKDRASTEITHMGFIDHLIKAGAEDAQINLTLAPVKRPDVNFVFPSTNLKTNTDVRISETSTLNEYTVTPDGCGTKFKTEIKQLCMHEGLEIFKNFKLVETVYDWGDGGLVKVDKTGNGSTSSVHQYSVPGKYTISAKVKSGLTASYTEKTLDVTVSYNEPVVDFDWESDFALKGQEKVTFNNKTDRKSVV